MPDLDSAQGVVEHMRVQRGKTGGARGVEGAETVRSVRMLGPGRARRVRVRHRSAPALELEFFIPAAVWDHPATQMFIDRLLSIVPGATVDRNAQGVWRRQVEASHVLRMVVERPRVDAEGAVALLQPEVGRLVAELAAWGPSRQREVMFTVRPVVMSVSTLVGG